MIMSHQIKNSNRYKSLKKESNECCGVKKHNN